MQGDEFLLEDSRPVIICWKENFSVAVEMSMAISCDTFAEAVANFIGVLYAMNCKYPKRGCNTYNFIQQILLKVPGKLPARVLSLHEKLLKKRK